MQHKVSNLIWIDLEMTGLDPSNDLIIEIATVVTDNDLNILAQGPVLAINQSPAVMQLMDDWNQRHHGRSGLIDRVLNSDVDEDQAQEQTLAFLREWAQENKSPMCGNSICQDRRFLYRCMPELERFFHYRNLDVSTLKDLAVRWSPELLKGLHKKATHQALEDTLESIAELKYYRQNFLKV